MALLLLGGVLVSKISDRFGVPALLLFLALGMLAGSDGPGGIYFANYGVAQAVGIVALAFILFSGGLDTNWSSVKPVLWSGLSLATVGTLLAAILTAIFAALIFRISWTEGLLLGAIVASTDAAAVLAVLRGNRINLEDRLTSLIEWESGSNDPMAVFLTVGAIELVVQPMTSPASLLLHFALQMSLGALLGYVLGRLTVWLINRVRLGFDGLYPVLTMAMMLLVFGGTHLLGGSGFLAVYVAGMALGNHVFVHKGSLLRFHDGMAWLMQIAMFLMLGLLVFPHELLPVFGAGLLFTAFLLLIARPLSVYLALALTRFGWREKAFVSWAGLRGAVPIILATYPLLAGIDRAAWIFNLVFFVVLASVLLQGTTIRLAARWLRLEVEAAPTAKLAPEEQAGILSAMREVSIPPQATAEGRALVDLDLPAGFLIVMVQRGDQRFIPNGQTILHAGDHLLVLARDAQFEQVTAQLTRTRAEG